MASVKKTSIANGKPPAISGKPSISRPKIKGANIKAFIESIESGKKPVPDFFRPDVIDEQVNNNQSHKPIEDKPPTVPKKPAINSKEEINKNVNSNTIHGTSQTMIMKEEDEYMAASEIGCPTLSEDSGVSTCDLKYSGSVSSNHSSSHDPQYQALTEYSSKISDEGYSDQSQNEVVSYSDVSELATSPETADTTLNRSKLHRGNAYKYHVTGKGSGTLTRGLKNAAEIGKAVAKGRNTLKRKTLGKSQESCDDIYETISDAPAHHSAQTNLVQRDEDLTSEFDGDFTDSEWETDSDTVSEKGHNSNNAEQSSNSDKVSLRHSNSEPERQSTFYTPTSAAGASGYSSEAPADESPANDHSYKKGKQVRLKKRLKNIKKNILQKYQEPIQKFVQTSNDTFSAVKTLFSRQKSPPGPIDKSKNSALTELGHEEDMTSKHRHIDISKPCCPSSDETRLKTRSTVLSSEPPPLPHRESKSMYIDLEETLIVPPTPPPRTSSLAPEIPSSEEQALHSDNRNQSPLPSGRSCVKPSPTPRSPLLRSKQHNGAAPGDLTKSPIDDRQKSAASLHAASSMQKTMSAPVITDDSQLKLPKREESTRSLATVSLSSNESIRRRNQIFSSVQKWKEGDCNESVSSESSGSRSSYQVGGDDDSENMYAEVMVEEEPLYQEYHACVVKPSPSPTFSRTSTLLKRTAQPSSSLWSSMPQVIDSNMLDRMAPEEIKLQEAMFEVITSEASYLRSLNILVDIFVQSKDFSDEAVLSSIDKKSLFSNIIAVREVASRLFAELESHWKRHIILTDISDIICKYTQKEFDVYIKYCSNQAFQDKTLKRLLCNSKEFKECLTALERSGKCHGLPMSSFLLLPMQRITRYPLLLDAIIRREDTWSDQGRKAQACYEQLKKVVKKCNEGATKMEQAEQVVNIEKKLLFLKTKKIALISGNRFLIKRGDMQYITAGEGRNNTLMSFKPKPLTLFLFNDLLLITKKKGENYSVLDYTARANVETEVWSPDALTDPKLSQVYSRCSAKFLFMMVLLENHQKKHAEYILACQSETERTRWTEAFKSITNEEESNDKIYESWDCPQVQVLHPYTAQEADELSLNAGDLINILRKTADGWYEGERVSDGQSGWLPANYTVEIATNHTKAKRLKERNKFLQAAAKKLK